MKTVRKLVIVLVVIGGVFFSDSLMAGDPIRKLGRGFCNVGFGVLEIPLCVYDTNQEEGGLAALTYGLFKGIALFVAREGVGLTEIVTFPMPLPNCPDDVLEEGWGYGPMMRPEWIIDPSHNAFNIFYQDTAMVN
ncbi:MAG: hypothetical protein A2020_04130 [Lentisphaerae bacterium GWF2_45_14]|nr:MAG: hypothetical protein A2020_04130 [Lentisphaerae bacterium GWF2_45_14]